MSYKREEIIDKVLGYLQKHPEASDTLEGISRWWVEHECVGDIVDKVSEALEVLLEKGLLEKSERCGDTFRYRLMQKGDGL